MKNLDQWANSIARELKKALEEEIGDELKKTTVLYAEIFQEAILRQWESYLNSYSPKMYNRTGMTSAGIIVDSRPKVNIDKTIEASVQFLDSYMYQYESISGGRRHVFMAMNDGWGDKSLSDGDYGYRYYGFEGIHILEAVERELKAILPPYINLEIKWSGKMYG